MPEIQVTRSRGLGELFNTVTFKEPAEISVRPAGIEPAAYRLEGGCSIRLSYGH